ncbi:prostaglandin reductase 1-like [Phymastichus coffea]|uniref:prostaglandin reductase 1-like n=1 Tax=Phymastichus coffea TaxID=108790 RepID=UPI00273BF39A|nr:prostaglandin reductase 1-like [Phymastichus coffea]XP_058801474.1 prostaglandin reductase 1-like [Phymastichus coffea]
MVKAKKFVLTKHFVGEPKPGDLTLVEFDLPELKDGEILVQAEYLSVDPYMRPYSARFPIGTTMIGGQVAKIIKSKNPKFPVDKRIVGYLGWTTHSVLNPDDPNPDILNMKPYIISGIMDDLPVSFALGMAGMPGNTAYFGLTEICQPKAGETLVVSGAAGAVGSHVGQIGKILGMKVIGIAGSDAKCQWLVNQLKFDHAINYKTEDVSTALKKAAPDGVDCYFDNVGGEISSTVIYQMRLRGRVSICGSISSYNADMTALPKATIVQLGMIFTEIKMEGFMVTRWNDRWMEAIQKNVAWIREGKLISRETVTEGFENMFKAFTGMLKGENFGKAIVKV